MASEDDLDAFFDEVEEVEQEAKNQVDETVSTPSRSNESASVTIAKSHETTMGELIEGEQDGQRPAKKARTEEAVITPGKEPSTAPSQGGRGTVVVSKKAVVVAAAASTSTSTSTSAAISAQPSSYDPTKKTGGIYQITVPERLNPPPPPPPQPPLPPSYAHGHDQNHNTNYGASSRKPVIRLAAGKKWTDSTLSDFPENDFRLFVGNLAKEITEEILADAFRSKYESFAMARIIYDKISGESKGYGFISVMDPKDCAKAIREMDQSWLGARPIKVKRSDWKERDLREVRKNKKKKNRRR